MKKILRLALIVAFIPGSALAAPDPNAKPPADEIVFSSSLTSGFGIALPINITPNNFCQDNPGENLYSCMVPGVRVVGFQRYSQIADGADNPARETVEILGNGNVKIRIHAGENGAPIFQSCENMAMKVLGNNTSFFGVEFKYAKNSPHLASRIGKNNEVDIVVDSSQGPAQSVRCFLIPGFNFHQ